MNAFVKQKHEIQMILGIKLSKVVTIISLCTLLCISSTMVSWSQISVHTFEGESTFKLRFDSDDDILTHDATERMYYPSRNVQNFPCHYMTNRQYEYNIIPHYDKQKDAAAIAKSSSPAAAGTNTTRSKYDISVATMMSPSEAMFGRLLEMMKRWSGPISVSVFINDSSLIKSVQLMIRQFKYDNALAAMGSDRTSSSRVSFHLVTDMDSNRGKDVNMFPRNLLRNVAVDNAEADYVLVLDVDFAPSMGAHENLVRHLEEVEQEMELNHNHRKYALVIPAFEMTKSDKYKNVTVITKDELLAMNKIDSTAVLPFMLKSKLQAHEGTRSERWYNENNRYNVGYSEDYEPYVVVRKDKDLPPFWEHFSGFGRNKLQWIEELYLSGHQFIVVPDTFVLHKAHKQYGMRWVRPFIADEYVLRFQKYLEKTYGKTLRGMEPLKEWRDTVYSKWEKKVIQKGRTTSFTTMEKMSQMSDSRDGEFNEQLKLISARN